MALNSPLHIIFHALANRRRFHLSCRPVQKVPRRSSAGSAILATIPLDCPRTYITFHLSARMHRSLVSKYCIIARVSRARKSDLLHFCGRAGEAVRDPGGIASSSKMRRLFGPLLAACESMKAMSAQKKRGSEHRPFSSCSMVTYRAIARS